VAPPTSKAVGKRPFLPHRLRQLFSSITAYYERTHSSPSLRIGSYLHRISNYISPREATLTSASLVPLTTEAIIQTEYDFTVACESWASSWDLDIFNDLSQPFQTRPWAPVQQDGTQVPVQQGIIQVPVHQGISDTLAPVHQEELEIPVHQAIPSLLQNLPAIEAPHQPLGIELPRQDEFDIVLRDHTQAVQPARIPLPPSPPSVELSLHDCPVEAENREIVLLDAPLSYPPRETDSVASTESTDFLEHTFQDLDITMSPAQPQTQPQAQPQAVVQPQAPEIPTMADELEHIRNEMDQMRLARESDLLEIRRLYEVNHTQDQALKRTEHSYSEEVRRLERALEAASAQAPRPPEPTGLAASQHAPLAPALGEPGPSNWQNPRPQPAQSGFFNPQPPQNVFSTQPTQAARFNPPDPRPAPPPRPRASAYPHFQVPQWTAPPQPNTELLTELTRLQALFAANQHAVNEQLLARTAEPRKTARDFTTLKAADIGLFEPDAQPDPAAAMLFIDHIHDAVKQYGAERVLLVLKRCCNNKVALHWLTSLSEAHRDELITSVPAWERLLRRDFMPKPADLEERAKEEVFKWSQQRMPTQYVTEKIRLLRMAGITNPDDVVYQVHKGFHRCPEIQIPLTQSVKEKGKNLNDVDLYRSEVFNYQDMAKLQYEFHHRPVNATYAPRNRDRPPVATPADAKKQGPPRPPQKERPRKRKCRNFPNCGDGEHWDWECRIKAPERDTKKRAYYALDDDEDDDNLCTELRDEDPDIEQSYIHNQNAHFAAAYCASKGFFGGTPRGARMPSPKPSECRACHEAFPSRSKLHTHLLSSGHNRPAQAVSHFAVIKSKHVAPHNHEARLASYHFAEAQFVLEPGSSESRNSCVDSGYGNSAVDAEFASKHIANPDYVMLAEPKEVHGIGGGVAMCTKLLRLPFYYPTMDGNYVELIRPFHVFPDLGVDLLCGIDTIREEGIDLFFSSSTPQMRIASCQNAAVKINVRNGDQIARTPVRAAATTIIPANSTSIVEIKVSRQLPRNQDYLFTPSKLKSVSNSGAGAPHAVVSHDQKNIMFTNLQDTEMTLFKNTVVGYLHSTGSEEVAVWHEAAQDVRGFLGLSKIAKACTAALAFTATTKEPFDPETSSHMPLPSDAIVFGDSPPFPLEPPRPRPCPVASAEVLPDASCAEERWSPPPWLREEYFPRYEYDLPDGISIPDVTTTTYTQVVINETDDISPEQIEAIRQLVARHPHLFNDGMGCVREPMEEWMRLPVDRDYELKLKPRGPYRLSKKAELAIDTNFDELQLYGRLEYVTKATPWGLQVFVVYKGPKERPVIDMRPLNDALAGDSYPLPRMESIIEPLKGMRWLGTVDITSAFYQRLLHPDDRHRAAVVTHRGVEQFATTVMGCKNSVQHQQKLMDKRVLSKLSWRGAACYVDDIVIYAATFQEFITMTDEVFRVLSDLGITLKARKCYLGFHSIELLGYLVDRLGLTTTEAKSDAIAGIPFPATLAQLEYFIGLTNWNRHLVPYYAQRVAPLQACKTSLLKPAPLTKRSRKIYAAKTPVPKDDILLRAFEDLKEALASRPRIHHFEEGKPIYAFLDSSREYGTGLAVYQLTGDPDTYCKTRLVPLHFLSKRLTSAESRYWPTDMELAGLVWSAKKLRPYMERSFVWFVTDHRPNVDIFDMKSLLTTSTSRSNLRLQTWGIYLSQFWGRMQVVYSKGANLDCPDALSRLSYEVSSNASRLQDWATALGKEPDTDEFEVSEAFAVTRSSTRNPPAPQAQNRAPENATEVLSAVADLAPMPEHPAKGPSPLGDTLTLIDPVPDPKKLAPPVPATVGPESDITPDDDRQLALSLVTTQEVRDELRHAVLNSQRFSAVRSKLLNDGLKTSVDGATRFELPSTCQYVLHDDLLYLIDPPSMAHRLVLGNAVLQKKHLIAAHSDAHYGCGRMMEELKPYYWPKMSAAVRSFLKHCPQCLRNKPANHRPFGLLSPIPAPTEPFDTWSIDLITDLPPSRLKNCTTEYDTVMTVTDKYTKAVRFLPGRKDWSAAEWAEAVYEGVTLNGWGYPRTLVSDRDRRFLSALWNSILELSGTRHVTTTAYHPSADGQAERTNFSLEVSLRFFVNVTQDDWVSKLKSIEAQMNNAISASTKQAPNEIMYGKKVRLDLTSSLSELPADADELTVRRETIRQEATRAIAFAQKAMKEVYDRRREAGNFETGWAFLRLGNGYTTPGINKAKLGPQRIGPFEITEVLSKGRAFRLKLPPHYAIHEVISIAHLEPAPVPNSDPYKRTVNAEDIVPVYRDGQKEWELETLVKKRFSNRNKEPEYLGRWKDCGPEWDQWIKLSELGNAKELIEEFEKRQIIPAVTEKGTKAARRREKVKKRGKD
jgi:hypothetical protein